MPDTITITDDRTGKTVTVPIEGGVFPSSALRELDPVAYVRFASVYRDFQDVGEFVDELSRLRD